MSVLGLFVLRGLLVTLAVRQPFVVMNGPSSSRVAMNVDNTVSAGQAAQAAQRRGQSTRPIPRSHATRTHARRALSLSRPQAPSCASTTSSTVCGVASDARRGRREHKHEHEHEHEHEHDLDLDLEDRRKHARAAAARASALSLLPSFSACCWPCSFFWAEACAAVVSTVGGRVALPC